MAKFDRNEWLPIMSDMSKDATGCRLRWDYAGMDDAELESTVNYFQGLINESIARDEARWAFAKFRFVNHIRELMNTHNIDKETALRWDQMSMGKGEDYIWNWDLPYGTNITELLREV